MIFQAGPQDLLPVEEILGPDETHDGVHEQRVVSSRYRVRPRLASLLIHTVMCAGGKRTSLSGLEIHHVGSAPEFACGLMGLVEHRETYAERAIRGLRSGDRLKDQVHRCAP